MNDPDSSRRPEIRERSRSPGEDLGERFLRESIKDAFLGRSVRPHRVARFVLHQRLGVGAMGAVFVAVDPDLGRRVALKLVARERLLDAEARERLRREAQALAQLSHPNVVHVYEVAEHEGQVFVAMELVRGCDLRTWLQTPRRWRAIVDVFVQAGRGLVAAHEAGLVHRDFKPANVLVGDDGRVRVADFGLARAGGATEAALGSADDSIGAALVLPLTATGARMGTPAYMAPEQWQGDPIDARVDQFALCVALHEALYGARPFPGETMEELAAAIGQGPVLASSSRRGVPASVMAVVRRGLAHDPEQRWPSMSRLVDELERATRSRWPRRLAALVGLSAVLVAGWALLGSEPQRADDGATASARERATVPDERPVEREVVEFQRLTRTPGYGIEHVELDPSGTRLLYRSDGDYWIRDVEGGIPRRVPAPLADYVLFDPPGPGLLIATRGALWRWREGSSTELLLERLGVPDELAMSPDGQRLVSDIGSTMTLWDLPSGRRLHERSVTATMIAWSADGQRLAVDSIESTGRRVLWVLDRDGRTIADRTLEGTTWVGLAWVAPRRLAVGVAERGQARIACYAVDDDQLTEQPDMSSAAFPVTKAQGFTVIRGARPGGRLIALESRHERDITLLFVADAERERRLSPGQSLSNTNPAWSDPGHLIFSTERFGRPTAMELWLPGDEPRAVDLAESVRWITRAGPGRALLLAGRGPRARAFWLQDGRVEALPGSAAWADAVDSIECSEDGRCLGMLRSDQGRDAAWVAAGVEPVPAFGCPDTHACTPASWDLHADGTQVLLPRRDGRSVSRARTTDGEIIEPIMTASPGTIVQSATWGPGADEYLVTLMSTGSTTDDHERYVLARVRPGGSPQPIWRDDRRWALGPRVSPDGGTIAVETTEVHQDVVALSGAGACAG